MKIISGSKKFPKKSIKTIVVLGNFDGVHLAHQKMFQWAKTKAKLLRLKTIIYTFYPHPALALARASAPNMIMTLEQKIEAIHDLKIPYLVIEPFNLKFAHQTPETWFNHVIVKNLHAAAVVAGYDFTFGRHRVGNVELLQELCKAHNIKCFIMHAYLKGETLVSSSQIRHLVETGQVEKAKNLLGRYYYMDGTIIRGKARGKKLGIPTANLAPQNTLIPTTGVYATKVRFKNRLYPSVTNVGLNPTFGKNPLSIETYILNFKKDIYGEKIRLYFLSQIREERKFESIEALKTQIAEDIRLAKRINLKASASTI
ncbi:MAG: bifunctional riboflavin kinase/FAD synthetase [Deltaproteobacteria bacterium]|nr:bifunctional riboflavin kinase/FAD synthetase [Deltaproteobacteria bacterium]